MSNDANKLIVSGTTLGSFELFQALDNQTRTDIATYFKIKQYTKGQYVISEAQSSNDVFFLVSGTIYVCAFTQQGKQVHFEELSAGMMFGELTAIDNMARSSDCIATSTATLAILSAEDFHTLINDYEPVRTAVVNRLVYLVRLHMRKVYELTSFPVSQRIRFELLRIASAHKTDAPCNESVVTDGAIYLQAVPKHAEIAARIGTHREAVTRELKSLEAAGVITWRHGEHVIHDIALLTSKNSLS